jgi:NADH-quinone oxidoreductase subunit C
MDEQLAEAVAGVRERFPMALSEPIEEFGELSVDVARDRIADVSKVLRDEVPFELLSDLSCVDYLGVMPPERRFLVALHLSSSTHPRRIRLRVWLPEGDERCPTVTLVWPGANFMEREAYDFFGITFEGHPDLRRIFMPDEWEGHPQRKDYPLGGVNVTYHHGAYIPPPDVRKQPTTTTGYPGRIS